MKEVLFHVRQERMKLKTYQPATKIQICWVGWIESCKLHWEMQTVNLCWNITPQHCKMPIKGFRTFSLNAKRCRTSLILFSHCGAPSWEEQTLFIHFFSDLLWVYTRLACLFWTYYFPPQIKILYYSGTLLIWPPKGHENLTVLMGWLLLAQRWKLREVFMIVVMYQSQQCSQWSQRIDTS